MNLVGNNIYPLVTLLWTVIEYSLELIFSCIGETANCKGGTLHNRVANFSLVAACVVVSHKIVQSTRIELCRYGTI
jgi:hypothetical protein